MRALIAGAGVAGLSAAADLLEAGARVTIFEARERVGGRVLTDHSSRHGLALDLGAEFVHGSAPETHAQFERPKHQIHKLNTTEKVFWDNRPAAPGNVEKHVEKLANSVDLRAPDRSLLSAVHQARLGLSPLDHAMMLSYLEGFNAADVHSQSAHAFKRENAAAGDDILESSRVLAGYDSLVDRLERKVRDRGGEIRLSTPVTEVRWRPGEVHTLGEVADFALLTLPPRVLPSVTFEPKVPENFAAAARIVTGHVYKLVMVFKEPLWDRGQSDMQFVHTPQLTFNVRWSWNWLKPFTITSWSAGSRALKLQRLSREELIRVSLQDLEGAAGRTLAELEALIDEVHYHDWVSDPYSLGAYSYVQEGGQDARERLARPCADTLFFAGEAVMDDGSAGTVHGALRSGQRAAAQMLRARA